MTPRVGVYTPWGLEFTRQRPTHSLEEELVLCVSASLSPSALSVPLCPLPFPGSPLGTLALFPALRLRPSQAV